MKYTYGEFIPVLKAISDETRLKIIDMLSCEELCANEILEEFRISQPTLSYHMKILTEAGIVQSTREGGWIRYRLDREKTKELTEFITYITTDKEDCICRNGSRKKNPSKKCN